MASEVVLTGTVIMMRVDRPLLSLRLDDGREVEVAYAPSDLAAINEALVSLGRRRVRLRAVDPGDGGTMTAVGVSTAEPRAANGCKPLWQVLSELHTEFPVESLADLPDDLGTNLDHYLYGTPKQET